jgi:hypothetical protein
MRGSKEIKILEISEKENEEKEGREVDKLNLKISKGKLNECTDRKRKPKGER